METVKGLIERVTHHQNIEEEENAMKIARLLILEKEDVRERLVQLGADVPDGLTADQLGNLYSEWLEQMPADVDLVAVYIGGNQMNIIANDDAVWELPDKADPT
jgi:hypothetical protein